jgi:hypothetical protein
MAITTVENLTTVDGGTTGVVFPIQAGQTTARHKIRVIRFVTPVAAGPFDVVVQNVAHTIILWESHSSVATGVEDQTTFPDEHEFRGGVDVTTNNGGGRLFFYHG